MIINYYGRKIDLDKISAEDWWHLLWHSTGFVYTDICTTKPIYIMEDHMSFSWTVDIVEETRMLIRQYKSGDLSIEDFDEEIDRLARLDEINNMVIYYKGLT